MWASVRSVFTVGGLTYENVIRKLGMKVVKMSKEQRDSGRIKLYSLLFSCFLIIFFNDFSNYRNRIDMPFRHLEG